eukprot:TRINITY_DN10006_c0_g1_i1.p1 TRINITY_DN10006_c0_g1~~TRINITY_DN10006_c0_g1_i1.p1  ORF type:complete len:576 (-),score=113.74 TRINITY_DN10006_c0_g1_i1:124-1851(-)
MIDYDSSIWMVRHLFSLKGSVIPGALYMAIPSGILCVLIMIFNEHFPDFQVNFGSKSIQAASVWNAVTVSLLFALGFRTDKAYSRFWEGTTLLHQMRGEWFDAASCLFAFSKLAMNNKRKEVMQFRHALGRLMSLCHGRALDLLRAPDEEAGNSNNSEEGSQMIEYMDLGGLDQKVLRYLMHSKKGIPGTRSLTFNNVEVLIHMMQTLIVDAQSIGAIPIPPPILSRVFQTLSRGQVNLMNCSKIKTTYFPFPYAQLIAFMIQVLFFMTPVVMSGVLEHYHWGFICTFMPMFCISGMNCAAAELEMPFGDDSNDLPLQKMQDEMNSSMLMLIRDEADLLPGVADDCSFEWKFLAHDLFNMDGRSARELHTFVSDEPAPEPKVPSPKAMAQPGLPAIAPAAAAPAPAPPAADLSKETSGAVLELEAKVIEQTRMMDKHLEKFQKLDQTFDVLLQGASGLFDLLKQNAELLTAVSKTAADVASSYREDAAAAASMGPSQRRTSSDDLMADVADERQMISDGSIGPCPAKSPSAATDSTKDSAQMPLAGTSIQSPCRQHAAKHEGLMLPPDLGTRSLS